MKPAMTKVSNVVRALLVWVGVTGRVVKRKMIKKMAKIIIEAQLLESQWWPVNEASHVLKVGENSTTTVKIIVTTMLTQAA